MKTFVAALLCGSSLIGAAAQAQSTTTDQARPTALQTAEPAEEAEDTSSSHGGEVVVTGTRIVRPNNKSAAPIQTVTSADIVAQGAVTIDEVINRLPQAQVNSEQNYADSEGRQRLKLRSLGYERTLTLVDGLRLGLQNGLDVSIIPLALVQRVDVLTGGASSVYGSDAVSGVINFVLNKKFEGITVTGNYNFYNHHNRENVVTGPARAAFFPVRTGWANDGARSDATLTAGKNLFDGAVNVSGFVSYREAALVPLSARSYSACEAIQTVKDGPVSCSLATFTAAGTIVPQSGAFAGRTLVNNPDGSRTFVGVNSGPGTSANPYDGFSFQRPFTQLSAGGFLTAELSSDIELHGSGIYYRNKSANPLVTRTLNFGAYGSTPFQVNCNNPFLSAVQAQTICGANAGTATLAPIDLRYRFDGIGSNRTRDINQGVRFTGGLRGAVLDGAWNYDVAGVYSRNTSDNNFGLFPTYDQINRSLNVVNVNGAPTCASVVSGTDPSCVPFNAFIPFNNDQRAYSYFTSAPIQPQRSASMRVIQALVTLSGDLGKYGITSPLAEQGVALAFGAEYRDEKVTEDSNADFVEFYGFGTDALTTATQNIVEVNTEAQIPLIEKKSWTDLLQVNAGYRVSKYNRLEDTFNTWKVEGLWSPIADITFRGSLNRAAAAPSVLQATQADRISYTQGPGPNDPCAPQGVNGELPPRATLAQCRATGLSDNLYGSATLRCPDQLCTIRNGGLGLGPETARTATYGIVLRPRFLRGLVVSVDRWKINLDNSLSYFSAGSFVDGCVATGLDYYCRGIIRNPGTGTLYSPPTSSPTTGFILQGQGNAFNLQSHGWDFQGQYDLGLGSVGRLNLAFNGTLMTRVGSQDSPQVAPRNCVGYYGRFCGESMPRWAHTLRTTWSSLDQTTNVSLNWRHAGSQTISFNADDPDLGIPVTAADRLTTFNRVAAADYFDLTLGFDIAKRFTFRITANNLFDRDPPIITNSRSTLGLLRNNTLYRYDLLGRQIVIGGSVHF